MSEQEISRRSMIARIAAPGVLAASAAVAGERPRRGKVLMPIGDATEMMDTLYPFFRIPEDGFQLVVAGPEARLYHGVMHEIPPDASIPWDITREQPSYHIKAEIAFRDVKPEEYCAIFISGGRAPEYLRYDKDLMRIVKHFGEAKKLIGFTCHGVEIATAAGVIRGCKVTTVAKCALDAEQGGATYVNQPVVKAGHVISCGTWHDYAPFFAEFMKMLNAL